MCSSHSVDEPRHHHHHQQNTPDVSLVGGEGKNNPHKQPPSHAIYACLFVSLFPFPFVPFSPGSVRFDSFLMQVAMIVKLWNFQKK